MGHAFAFPGPAPRKVRIVRWWPLWVLVFVSLFMTPHTIVGALLCYTAISETIYAVTGVGLPMPADNKHEASVPLIWLVAMIWNTLLITVWIVTWRQVWIEYQLLSRGQETTGKITNKRTSVKGTIAHGVCYEIDFEYSEGTGAMEVSEGFFNKISIGDSVDVCYDPARPARSIVIDGCWVFAVRGA